MNLGRKELLWGMNASTKRCCPGRLLIVALALLDLAATTNSTNVHNIHWNTSNPMFRFDSQDNVIDIKSGTHPYDQVNIVCPVYKPGTNEALQEQYIIYSVSKQEFDSCRITQQSPKIIAVCDRPFKQMYFTITFRSFTPTPGGLEFRPGHNYYFISTSSKSDLHRRVGGRCSSHNMKVAFRVAPNPNYKYKVVEDEDNSQDNQVEQVHHPLSRHFQSSPPSEDSPPPPPPSYTTYYYPKSELDRAERNFQSHEDMYSHQKSASVGVLKSDMWLLIHVLMALNVIWNLRYIS